MKTRLFFSRCDLGAKKAGEQARCTSSGGSNWAERNEWEIKEEVGMLSLVI